MAKLNFQNVEVTCYLQQVTNLIPFHPLSGIFTQIGARKFRFEETIPHKRCLRNAKLYEGKLISMVRQRNGKLKIHLREINETEENLKWLPQELYLEVKKALETLL